MVAAAAVTGGLAAFDHALDDGGGTADTGIHLQGIKLTIHGAGPALHAKVMVHNHGLFISHNKNTMRADLHASPAPGAFSLIQLQSLDIG